MVRQRDEVVALGHFQQRPRRTTEQHGQRVARAQHLALQLGNAAEGAEVLGLGLLQVELVAVAAAEQALGDLVAALLAARVFAGDPQARLGGAQREVGFRHLRAQQHQGVLVVGPGGKVAGVRRLDRAAEAPPEVEFPADVETGAVLPQVAVERAVAARLVVIQIEGIGAGLLQLRIAPAVGDAELGARFEHPQAGDPQRRTAGVGLGDQAVQHRVVELAPPLAAVRLRSRLAELLQRRAVGDLAKAACLDDVIGTPLAVPHRLEHLARHLARQRAVRNLRQESGQGVAGQRYTVELEVLAIETRGHLAHHPVRSQLGLTG